MNELYPNINDQFRLKVQFIFEMAMQQSTITGAIKVINNFLDTCYDEEKEFAEFYFGVKLMERANNESDIN